jgi:hypothetical protein
MAILTKPTIAKGQPNEIDLSKSELALLSKVVNDSYFSDQTNWSKVIVEYKSAEGNQHEMMIFDASEASPKANFEVSEKARDSWEVQSVKIMDFDGGYLKLGRGDLTVEEFDIVLSSSTSLTSLTWFNLPATMDDSVADTLSGTGSEFRSNEFIPAGSSGYIEFKLDVYSTQDFPQIYLGGGIWGAGISVYGNEVYAYKNGGYDGITVYPYNVGDTFKIEFDHTAGNFGEWYLSINDVVFKTVTAVFQNVSNNKYMYVYVPGTSPANDITISSIGMFGN